MSGIVLFASQRSAAQTVTTLAGSGVPGCADGEGIAATFNNPTSVAADLAGNVYVADESSNRIRKITPNGVVRTLAGTGRSGSANGPGASATFSSPIGVAVDRAGVVYVADYGNHMIRKVTPGGVVSTYAGTGVPGDVDGHLGMATFNGPSGLAIDDGGTLYVADMLNNKIRKISPAGAVTTLAGSGAAGGANGKGAEATFTTPSGVAVDDAGNVYVADLGTNRIRKVTPGGLVTTYAGSGAFWFTDGPPDEASFNTPAGVAVDRTGTVYVADEMNNRIRVISPDRYVRTLTATGQADASAPAAPASFAWPTGLAVDPAGNLYVAEQAGHRIRKVTAPPSDLCTPDAVSLCLFDGRFRLQADYRDFDGNAGQGKAVAVSTESGYFWFFGRKNMEITAKIVSFCNGANGNYAFYAGGMTDVDVTLKLTDMKTGTYKEYRKGLGAPFCTIADGPFSCP